MMLVAITCNRNGRHCKRAKTTLFLISNVGNSESFDKLLFTLILPQATTQSKRDTELGKTKPRNSRLKYGQYPQ